MSIMENKFPELSEIVLESQKTFEELSEIFRLGIEKCNIIKALNCDESIGEEGKNKLIKRIEEIDARLAEINKQQDDFIKNILKNGPMKTTSLFPHDFVK